MAELSNNQQFLRSLSDSQLDEEIYWGAELARNGRHKKTYAKDLEEAKSEKERRAQSRRFD